MIGLYLQDIYIYPIKSLGGISVQAAEVQATGLLHDRRWMLVDETRKFLSQRTCSQMALLQVSINDDSLVVTHKNNLLAPLTVPFDLKTGHEITVSILDDSCTAITISAVANEWFTYALGMPVRLVYMPDATRRYVEVNYAANNEVVSFADAYPFLIIAQASLDDLNDRLSEPLLMNRFRPNFVFAGGTPYCEDSLGTFSMGGVTFSAVKPCARCVLTTVNQENGTKGKEPLKTLATYRTFRNKILFGQNLLHSGAGMVKKGDAITLMKK